MINRNDLFQSDMLKDDELQDIMPTKVWNFSPNIVNIVTDYAWETLVQKPTLFHGVDRSLEKILFLVEHAGPLERFEYYVRRLINRELANNAKQNALIDNIFTIARIQGPLIAVIVTGIDQTIRDNKGTEINKGMAECFIDIIAELPPHRLENVKEQVRKASPFEDRKTEATREAANFAALEYHFNVIKNNDKKTTEEAITIFKKYVDDIKQCSLNNEGNLVDNRYYVNIIHLHHVAFYLLIIEGRILPATDVKDQGGRMGKIADQFCFKIIGELLQLDLPARARQILRSGLSKILQGNEKVERIIDHNGTLFKNGKFNHSLGIDSYYEEYGYVWGEGEGLRGASSMAGSSFDCPFKAYYEQLKQHSDTMFKMFQYIPELRCVIL